MHMGFLSPPIQAKSMKSPLPQKDHSTSQLCMYTYTHEGRTPWEVQVMIDYAHRWVGSVARMKLCFVGIDGVD